MMCSDYPTGMKECMEEIHRENEEREKVMFIERVISSDMSTSRLRRSSQQQLASGLSPCASYMICI